MHADHLGPREEKVDHPRRGGVDAREDVFDLAPAFESGAIAPPRYLPPWARRANGLAGILAFSLFANTIRLDKVDIDNLDAVPRLFGVAAPEPRDAGR